MDEYGYAKQLAEAFGVNEEDTLKMIRLEAESERAEIKGMHYPRAVEIAAERIQGWLKVGHEYAVRLDWQDIARFHKSHRPACVWAVLLSKAHVSTTEEVTD